MTNEAQNIIETKEDRDRAVLAKGNHIVTPEILEKAATFFNEYNDEMTEEEMKQRYAGLYVKVPEKPLSRSRLVRIWTAFVETERRDFILKHNTISLEDIVDIGIDKFVMTLGWSTAGHVSSWRRNVVRVGVCPECGDQFIPLMFQTNQGLCNNCRPNFSIKAIRRYIEFILSTNERYFEAHQDALMDFYIMFYNDPTFRKLFIKDSESAVVFETQEFEVPKWVEDVKAREQAMIQARIDKENDGNV